MYAYLTDSKAVHSSAFPDKLYFWYDQPRGICVLQARVRVHWPPCSGLRKVGWGPGNEALDLTGFVDSLVPSPSPHVRERGSGVLNDFSCHRSPI